MHVPSHGEQPQFRLEDGHARSPREERTILAPVAIQLSRKLVTKDAQRGD
jgi:hypothetical protein